MISEIVADLKDRGSEAVMDDGFAQDIENGEDPLADLLIGACALELGYAVGTSNARDFKRIPGLQLISL